MTNRVIVAHTGELADDELGAIRALLDDAFDGRFSDDDWTHGLGGMHAQVLEGDDTVIAHGSLVMRRLWHDQRSLRTGYVEGVAVRADRRRLGHGATVMTALERLAPAYDLLALSASEAGVPFYEARGWTRWRGASSVIAPDGTRPTTDDDGSIYVLGGAGLDLDGAIACDWRDGDVW